MRALELDSRQRSGAGRAEVLGLDRDDQPGVGERRVAAREAHAVDDHAVGLGRRRHDPAARAHAEAVDAALARGGRQLVEGRRQLGVARGGAVLDPIDERLRVLDAHADRDRLALDGDAGGGGPGVDGARRVADRQHDDVGRDLAAARRAPRARGPRATRGPSRGLEAVVDARARRGARAARPAPAAAGSSRRAGAPRPRSPAGAPNRTRSAITSATPARSLARV